ncbi:MAG: hypothetical protein EBX40_01235 [Gammaproteobacteria bacterium]|nr:hypothetical protein [Gammaproteobacteria bacterium]
MSNMNSVQDVQKMSASKKIAASVAALAVVLGAVFFYSHDDLSTMKYSSSQDPKIVAQAMTQGLIQEKWSVPVLNQVGSAGLDTWLKDSKNLDSLHKALAALGDYKGNLKVQDVRMDQSSQSGAALVVLSADFATGQQFINLSLVQEHNEWKLQNLSIISAARVFAEQTYVTSAKILNALAQNGWSADALKPVATANLQKLESDAKTQQLLAQLAALGKVDKVNGLLNFKFDPKTQMAEVLMDVNFEKSHRPVLMVMQQANNAWLLDGVSVLNYKEEPKTQASNNSSQQGRRA